MKETVLKIKGMHCMGCVLGLEENLEKLDFIDKAEGNLEENSVKIQYKDELDMNKIKAVVEELGFEIE